ncbi:MAG: class I SAM-dependent methyltransferase [Gemmatimonadales bacterium]
MITAQIDITQLKKNMQAMWMAGDFGKVALSIQAGGEEFVERLGIRRGMRVLDVACGTGNLSIPAARRGAEVTGVDIAANLLEQARARAAAEGLSAEFDEGDAEQMSYRDSYFDLTMTMFGAMFAPRPERTAAELLRVTRPGGRVAMANWTREGFVGKLFVLGNRYAPPPDGVPAPIMWGDEEIARERMAPASSKVQITRRTLTIELSFEPTEVVAFYREYFGPVKMQFARLDPTGQQAYAADMEALWREHNEAGAGRTAVTAEYLEVLAIRG